jgi:hypothetical protein
MHRHASATAILPDAHPSPPAVREGQQRSGSRPLRRSVRRTHVQTPGKRRSAERLTLFAVADVVIAGIAGLIGGFLTQFVYARRLAEEAHRATQLERLRQDRIQSYSDFAGSLIEYRRAQLARWFAERDGRASEGDARAREEAWVRRAAALDRYYRVVLLADSAAITAAAKQALDCAHEVSEAASRQEADARAEAEGLPRAGVYHGS